MSNLLQVFNWTVQSNFGIRNQLKLFFYCSDFVRNQSAIVGPSDDFYIRLSQPHCYRLAKLLGAREKQFSNLFQLPCNSTQLAPEIVFNISGYSESDAASTIAIILKPSDYIVPVWKNSVNFNWIASVCLMAGA